MENHIGPSSMAANQLRMAQGYPSGAKRASPTKQGHAKKTAKSGSVKEQQQVLFQAKNTESTRAGAGASSSGHAVRPALGSTPNLKHGSHSQLAQSKGLKSHPSSFQRISQDRIRLVNNQMGDQGQHQPPLTVQPSHQLPVVPSS